VQAVNAVLVARQPGHVGAGRQPLGLRDDERAVHQEQRLLRDRGLEALRAVRVRAGEVEGPVETGQVLAVDEAVERPAGRRLAGDQVHRGAAEGLIELAGGGEERVARRLEVQPPPVHAPQQLILRILSPRFGIVRAALLVRRREHDRAMQFLERPA